MSVRPAFHNSSLGKFSMPVNTIRAGLSDFRMAESPEVWRGGLPKVWTPGLRQMDPLKNLLDSILPEVLQLRGGLPGNQRQNGDGAAGEKEARP